MNTQTFSQKILLWYDLHGRKDLPWQQQASPYHVWLSEIMLQQTQVTTVIPYYQRFLSRFSNVAELAAAPLDEVLTLWSGLGYYARARNLHKAATIMVAEHNSELPDALETLMQLPGIGRSTAGAIMALAYHQRYPILDGNVKRVLARYDVINQWPGLKSVENLLWQRAEQLLPEHRVANYIQAQMDLGATLCTRTKPQCFRCPLNRECQAYASGNPTQYPVAKPKKVTPLKQTYWLIARRNNGQIFMQQRQPHGIWGGLWSFPELENEKAVTNWGQDILKIVSPTTALPSIHHVFTHFKLDIFPILVTAEPVFQNVADKDTGMWVKIEDALNLALPAPVKTLLTTLK